MVATAPSEIFAQPSSFMRQRTSSNSTSYSKCDPIPRRDTAHEDPEPSSDRNGPGRKSEILTLTKVISLQKTVTTGLIIRTADLQPEPVHPRANFSTQELIDFYLRILESHTEWVYDFISQEVVSPACSDFPNLDSSEREGDKRDPIPTEERNFHCTNREPAEFEYGSAEKECPDSRYELTEEHMAKRWKIDYVRRNQNVDSWFAGAESLLPVTLGKGSGSIGRGLGKAREKLVGVRRDFGKKCKVAFEGNALV